MEFTLLWAAGAGMGALWTADRRINPADRRFDDLLAAALLGLVIGRLGAMIQGGSYPWLHPGLIPLVRGGVDPGWASLGALASLGWKFRRQAIDLATLSSPALFGLAGWESGCVFRSSCAGTGPGGWVLPIGLIAGALFAVAGWGLLRIPVRYRAPAALVAAAAIRLGTEPWRAALNHDVAWWYAAGLGLGSAALVAAFTRAANEARRVG